MNATDEKYAIWYFESDGDLEVSLSTWVLNQREGD